MKYVIKESQVEKIIIGYLNSMEWSRPWLDSMGLLLISEKGEAPASWKFGIREKDGKISLSRSFKDFLNSMFGGDYDEDIIKLWVKRKFRKYINN
jgi:hypothetical protein